MQAQQVARTRRPMLIVRHVNAQDIGVRFWNIGGRSQFLTILQRFRGEFILAHPTKINGLDWLLLLQEQMSDIRDFCRRYGLQVVEDEPC